MHTHTHKTDEISKNERNAYKYIEHVLYFEGSCLSCIGSYMYICIVQLLNSFCCCYCYLVSFFRHFFFLWIFFLWTLLLLAFCLTCVFLLFLIPRFSLSHFYSFWLFFTSFKSTLFISMHFHFIYIFFGIGTSITLSVCGFRLHLPIHTIYIKKKNYFHLVHSFTWIFKSRFLSSLFLSFKRISSSVMCKTIVSTMREYFV